MKKLLNKIESWLIKQGADKWLHFITGTTIAQLTMLLRFQSILNASIGAFVAVVAIEVLKETIDDFFSWKDLLFTVLGGVYGIGLSVLNIMLA